MKRPRHVRLPGRSAVAHHIQCQRQQRTPTSRPSSTQPASIGSMAGVFSTPRRSLKSDAATMELAARDACW